METLREINFEKTLKEMRENPKPDQVAGGAFLDEETEKAPVKPTDPSNPKKPEEEISESFITDDGNIEKIKPQDVIKTTPEKEKGENKELNYQEVLLKVAQELPDKPWKLREEIGQMLGSGKDWQKIPEVMDVCPNISELRENILEVLKEAGCIEKKPEGEVIDLEKFKKLNYTDDIRKKLSYKFIFNHPNKTRYKASNKKASYYNHGKKEIILFYAFNNYPLISKKDYKNKNFQPKELFYIPKSAEASLDIKQIKSQPDFHIGMWETGHDTEGYSYATNGEKINSFNTKVACVLYHPHFADGERDRNNKLTIKDENNQRKKIDSSFFSKYGIGKTHFSGQLNLASRPYEYLKSNKGEILAKKGILEPGDFSLSQKAREYPYKIHRISKNGYASIYNENENAIRYYIGKGNFSNHDYQAMRINNFLGAVIKKDNKGNRQLSHLFNLTNFKDEKLLSTKTNSGGTFKTAQKNITRTRKYNPEEIKDENQLKELQNFEKLLEKINEIKRISGIDLLPHMETKEKWVNINKALLETHKPIEEIGQFVKKYGLDNLSSFLDSSVLIEEFDKYINLGENLEEEVAKKIFNKFSEIVTLAKQSNEELLQEFFQEDTVKEIDATAEILKRGKRIVTKYSDKLSDAMMADKNTIYMELLKQLDEIKKDIIFFTAMFKTAYKEYGELDFEEIKNTQYEHLSGNKLSEADINIMKNIYLENFQNYPNEFKENLLKLFDASIKKDGVNFDILRYQDEIVGFLKFENQDKDKDGLQHKHFGAFNISKNYHNGKLGEVMLKKALDREKKNSVIHAECDPEAPITNKYFELGFKEIDKFVYKGVPSLHIEMREQDIS